MRELVRRIASSPSARDVDEFDDPEEEAESQLSSNAIALEILSESSSGQDRVYGSGRYVFSGGSPSSDRAY